MLKILIAGDFYPGPGRSVGPQWIHRLPVIREHDLNILNLEGPLTERESPIFKTGPALRIDPQWAGVIKESGFQVVSLANNHILDMGEPGLIDTLEECEQANLNYVGAGENLENARKALIFKANGIAVGLLAFAENEFSIATEVSAGAAPVDPIDNFADIQALGGRVDKRIVLLHGGNEHYPYPRPGLAKLCRFYVDAGADAVICHHSHTAGGYEIYKGAPIFYGTGNFYFPKGQKEGTDWNYGYLVSLEIKNDRSLSFATIPYGFDQDGVHLLENEAKEQFNKELQKKSEIIGDPLSLKKYWDSFCREKESQYIPTLFAYTRYDRILFRLKIFRPEFFRRKALVFLNFIRCESHRETILTQLQHITSRTRQLP